MTHTKVHSVLFGLVLGAWAAQAGAADSLSDSQCSQLITRGFSDAVGTDVTLQSAEIIAQTSALPSHCRITANIAPSTGVEIRLPVSEWNGRMLFTGCGGLCGVIRSEQGDDALARHYAVATTDMGHRLAPGENTRAWTVDQDLVEEWVHRATHRSTLLTKAVIAAAYGEAQNYAYFRGCSTGGRQGLTEALMYPGDYDGIISGAPAAQMVTPHNVFAYASNTRADGSPILTEAAITLMANAALKACDMDDGLGDGIIANPKACAFEPASLRCQGADSDACLTAEQVAAAESAYGGARQSDGTPYYPMGYAKGTELDWISAFLGVDGRPPRRAGSAGFVLEKKIGPGATLADFDYAKHGATGSPVGGLLDFGPDGKKLATYAGHGGKILLYHGWSDTDATPASSLFFYGAQTDAFGADAVPDFLRLFMLPGMTHCRGGGGVDTADYLTAIEAWVERGDAPESLAAYRTTLPPGSYTPFPLAPDTVVAGRTLFPYPAASEYAGSGDAADPANWRRK